MTLIRKTKIKRFANLNTGKLVAPWEQDEEDEAKILKDLQTEFLEREEKYNIEKDRQQKLADKKTTQKEKDFLQEEAEKIKKLYALDYWMRCFNKVSYYNNVIGQGLFHVCLGQALNEIKIEMSDDSKIDLRLHLLWIQDSGSGKGKALNFVFRIFNHPKFKYKGKSAKNVTNREYKSHKLGRMNAASLINTYELDKKGMIKKDENDNEVTKPGIIEMYDYIFSEEGRILLEGTKESFELQEILMTAMETIGSINNVYTKQLTNYKQPCETRCTASFAITTRPFGKVKRTLVESGLIQRVIFYPRRLSFTDREMMNRKSSFSFKTKTTQTEFRENFDVLINELNKIVDFAHNNIIDFDEEKIDDLLSFLHEQMMWFTYDTENTIPSEQNKSILQSFVSRYKENMVKMAFHSALMRFSKKVEKEDLQYAFDYFKELYEAQKIWVSLTVEEDKEVKSEDQLIRTTVELILKQDLNNIMTLQDLTKNLSKKFGKSYGAMKYHINKLAQGNSAIIEIEETAQKNKTNVRLII